MAFDYGNRSLSFSFINRNNLGKREWQKDFTHSERVAIGEAIEAELGGRHGGD